MSGGGGKKTTEVQDQAAADAAAKAAAAKKAAAEKAAADKLWQTKLNTAYSGGIAEAKKYFTDRGVDPTAYLKDITAAATKAKGLVPTNAATPDQYFSDIASKVFQNATDRQHAQIGNQFNTIAPQDFEHQRISDTADDPIIAALNNEQRQTAESYLKRLVDRGLIDTTGYNAAEQNINDQAATAQEKLREFGSAALNEGRTNLTDIASRGRAAGANTTLGQGFNVGSYGNEIGQALTDFFSNLTNNIRSRVPGSLYTTAGLANVAGGAQGAQNFAFDPRALAGLDPSTDQNNLQANFLSAF